MWEETFLNLCLRPNNLFERLYSIANFNKSDIRKEEEMQKIKYQNL